MKKYMGAWLSVALLVVTACASGGQVPDTGEALGSQVILIEVQNNLAIRQSVTVRVARRSGGVSTLGSVAPGRTQTLRFEESNLESAYVLHAQKDDGTEVVSREFSLYPNSFVRWRLSNNTVSVGTR
jgi:hypothetical protein